MKGNHTRGKFIVIEALDGAGKTTQATALANELLDNNFYIYTTQECTTMPIGKLLKKEYLSGNQKCSIDVINILMAADRLQHLTDETNGILPKIINGDNFLCDRYILSALAYDNYKLVDDYENWLVGFHHTLEVNRRSVEILIPDLVIYLDVSPERCYERIKARKGDKEIYEDLDRLRKIQKSYDYAMDEFVRLYPSCIIKKYEDSGKPIEYVTDDLYKIVKETLRF